MAKGQIRGNREARKPKQDKKTKPAATAGTQAPQPVSLGEHKKTKK